MILFYLAILAGGIYFAIKLLLPEMPKPPLTASTPVILQVEDTVGPKIEKLEMMLSEKNDSILRLQTELNISQAQSRDFEKIRAILEEEVLRLREQNRMFRSELGLPTSQPKENPVS
jgi:hypothetical protein